MSCDRKFFKMECYQKATELLASKDLAGSFKHFSEFIERQRSLERPELKEQLVDAYNARGYIRYLWVDFDEAIEDYTEAIRRNPDFTVAYYNRGQIHYRLGRYKLAERDLTKALQLRPEFTDAQLNLEQVMKDLGNSHKFNECDHFGENES